MHRCTREYAKPQSYLYLASRQTPTTAFVLRIWVLSSRSSWAQMLVLTMCRCQNPSRIAFGIWCTGLSLITENFSNIFLWINKLWYLIHLAPVYKVQITAVIRDFAVVRVSALAILVASNIRSLGWYLAQVNERQVVDAPAHPSARILFPQVADLAGVCFILSYVLAADSNLARCCLSCRNKAICVLSNLSSQ